MPPKSQFSAEDVVNAAVRLVQRGGAEAVSARAVAAELKGSTMAVYHRIGSMEALLTEVQRVAQERQFASQLRPVTGEPLLDLAIGYVAFAREEPRLFRFLFFERSRPLPASVAKKTLALVPEALRPAMRQVSRSTGRVAGDLDAFVLKNWIFVHGLACLVSSRVLQLDDAAVGELLMDAGAAFSATQSRG
ncbi:MAG: TetR/AcrR family transcriptional regulator [Archangium sp.]|nr:TetR/AcrR family transcriptional regulator [Archangium sp.]